MISVNHQPGLTSRLPPMTRHPLGVAEMGVFGANGVDNIEAIFLFITSADYADAEHYLCM
jgi:hypothetical protein